MLLFYARLAQQGEHLPYKQRVVGSSPTRCTIKERKNIMEKVKVVSSNVVAVGYENNRLFVDYKSGSYVYENVPKEIYDGLLKADSKGKYMHQKVKGRYDYARLD